MVELPGLAQRRRRRLDLLYGAHLALVSSLAIGRCLRGLSAGDGFVSGTAGRGAAFLAMILGIPALGAILVLTVLEWRDLKLCLLLGLMALAVGSRTGPDALDLAYAITAAALAAAWFLRGRRLRAASGRPIPPPGG